MSLYDMKKVLLYKRYYSDTKKMLLYSKKVLLYDKKDVTVWQKGVTL